jgi:hypothetical protein
MREGVLHRNKTIYRVVGLHILISLVLDRRQEVYYKFSGNKHVLYMMKLISLRDYDYSQMSRAQIDFFARL